MRQLSMVKVDTKDLLSITEFAKASRMTRQGVNKAIREGRLKVYETIGNHKFLHKRDIDKFSKL